MKKFHSLFLLLIGIMASVWAQAPQGVNYQAVARDGSGVLMANKGISVDFLIHSASSTGAVVYDETHAATTNEFALFNLVIGMGAVNSGIFADIDWNDDSYFLEVKLDGTSVGTTQMLSVPYALSVAPRKQYYSIPGAVFQPNNNAATFTASIGQGGATITQTGPGVTNVLDAQVNLPHGAVITHFTIYFRDESAAEDLSITLNRESLNGGNFNPIANITTSGSTAGWRSDDIAVANAVVDNQTYGHFIRVFCSNWSASGSKAIKGVVIEYTY